MECWFGWSPGADPVKPETTNSLPFQVSTHCLRDMDSPISLPTPLATKENKKGFKMNGIDLRAYRFGGQVLAVFHFVCISYFCLSHYCPSFGSFFFILYIYPSPRIARTTSSQVPVGPLDFQLFISQIMGTKF